MGILDDLKSQAEQKNKPAGGQPASAGAAEFYRAQVKQRMVMANDFLTQLVNQLNTMKLVIKAEYPFRPEGKNVTLLQQGYKAYSDNIPEPRQITLSFTCILANPTSFDVRGRGPALAQGELLERYQFKHEKLEARDQNQMVNGARFKLQGPLQVKCVLQFDEANQIIKLLLTNLVGPGTSQYNLKPEQLDETFMDHLGKYLLRKEAKLFQEEISEDAKAMLRKKLQQEQLQREAELRALEEQRQAEEAARKQNSTTEQLKKAVSQSVAENREKLKKVMDEQVREKGEKLKTMFNKLKNRAGFEAAPGQTSPSPAVNTRQTAGPTGNPAVQAQPPVNRQAGTTASARQNATRPKPSAEQKKPTPPKMFQASASNPFLKPEDFEPVPKGDEEQTEVNADMKNPAAQLPGETAIPSTAKTPAPTRSPAAAQARPTAGSSAPAAKTANPFLQTKAAGVQAETKKTTAQSPAQTATPATPTMSHATAQAKSVVDLNAPVAKTANPFLQTKADAGQAETKKPTAQSPVQTATPTTPMPSPAAEAKPVAAPNAPVAKTANSSMQTNPSAAPAEAKLSLEPIASDAESSSPAAPVKSGLSQEANESDSESSPVATKTEESQPEPSSDLSALSLEDELERDLARFMENEQQQPSLEGETSGDPSSTSGELELDLSSPDALEIHFENTDIASDQDNSEPKK
ncbi:MAG: hypothetical protein P8047_09955 [Gammaproteobacteria bacterium]